MNTTTVHRATVLSLEDDGLNEPFLKGTVQEPAYRDVWFGRAFYVQFVGVLVTAAVFSKELFIATDKTKEDSQASSTLDENVNESVISSVAIVTVLAVSLISAVLGTIGMFNMMVTYGTHIVEFSFIAAPGVCFLLAIIFAVVAPAAAGPLFLFGIFFAAISSCVYLFYRRFIPFASSTLRSALSAVQAHKGLFLLSLASQVASFLFSIVFIVAAGGIYLRADRLGTKVRCGELYDDAADMNPDEMCLANPPTLSIVSLLFCSYWTFQVVQNVVHVTTAGTVSSWWFTYYGGGPSSWCSAEVSGSFGRATTYSFGSICFGSLLVAIIQTLEQMARSARRNRNSEMLACVIECLLSCVRTYLEYFNSWAYVYVGIYGYDYLTAGKNVIALIKSHGWSSFVSDRLVFRVLYVSIMTIGLVSGGLSSVAALVVVGQDGALMGFLLGLVVGLVLANASLSIVESAVRTVIVSFAESPAEFQMNHPELCKSMKAGWAAAYPNDWTEEKDLRVQATVVVEDGNEKTALMVKA